MLDFLKEVSGVIHVGANTGHGIWLVLVFLLDCFVIFFYERTYWKYTERQRIVILFLFFLIALENIALVLTIFARI